MRLGISTTPLMLKSVVCQLIIIAFILGILLLAVSPVVERALLLFEQTEIDTHIQSLIEVLWRNPDSTRVSEMAGLIIDDIIEVVETAGDLFISIAWSYVGIILGLVGYRFLLSLSDYPVMNSMTDFMQTSTSHAFVWYFFKKFLKSAKFSLAQLSCVIWLDLFVFFGTVGFYVFILSPLGAVGVVLAVLMFILAYSVRIAFYACWLPEYVLSGKGVFASLSASLQYSVARFWHIAYKVAILVTASGLLSVLISYLLNLISCPAYVVTLITAFISFYGFYFIKCVGVVEYFEAQEKPYFTKKIKITDDTELYTIEIS